MSDKPKDVSGENESDPMSGVKEIKGADAPREPEVKIEIEKHQDAEDADSVKNEKTPTSGSSNPAPVSEASKAQSGSSEVKSEVKKSHKGRNTLLIILLILCFLCLACCVGTYAMRDQFLKYITNSATRQDSTLTTVTTEDVKSSQGDIQSIVDQKKAEGRATSVDGSYDISFTEAEFLSALFKTTEGIDPSSLGLKFENGKAKVQIDIGKILASQKDNIKNSPQFQNLPVDLSLLSGVIVSADITTSADGTKLKFGNVSTGNALLDSLIPPDVINSLGDEIDLTKALDSSDESQPESASQIERIQFREGQMVFTIKE